MLIPLSDRILIKPDLRPDTVTASGILLVEHSKLPENTGEVVSVPQRCGTDCPECGAKVFRVPDVKVGDIVLFSGEAGQELTIDGERLLMMREADILATYEVQPA
jgi:chaperonin GroES